VNDRGPFVGDRIIDLSYTAAHKLGMIRSGTAPVEIRVIEPGEEAPATTLTAAATPAATATSTPPATFTAPPPLSVTRYVQAGAFGARANAEAMLARLNGAGIDNALIREVTIAGRQWYRVQAGPIDEAAAVDALVERLRSAGIPDARPAHE
jgi:rare lipoprotein A